MRRRSGNTTTTGTIKRPILPLLTVVTRKDLTTQIGWSLCLNVLTNAQLMACVAPRLSAKLRPLSACSWVSFSAFSVSCAFAASHAASAASHQKRALKAHIMWTIISWPPTIKLQSHTVSLEPQCTMSNSQVVWFNKTKSSQVSQSTCTRSQFTCHNSQACNNSQVCHNSQV